MDTAVISMKKAPLFQGTHLEVVQCVASKSKQCVFLPGDVILQQDTSGDTMYILAEGTVNVSVKKNSHPSTRATNLQGWDQRQRLSNDQGKDEQFLRTIGPG